MYCRLITALLLCVLAIPVLAQDKPPVVLVWGEYLAAANPSEARGTRGYMENIARALDTVGLAYAETKDSEVETGALDGHKFAIFPYNADLTEAEHAAIRKFVAGGGKLWASYTRDAVLGELLGVKLGGSAPPEYEGFYASILFQEEAPAGVPDAVSIGSWHAHRIEPLEGAQIIGSWQDAQGKDTGMPALSMNANGYYHGHVMIGADADLKGQMFLALVGHFFPEVWKDAIAATTGSIEDVHGFGSRAVIVAAIEKAKAEGRDVAVAEERLAAAVEAQRNAEELSGRGEYAQVLDRVSAAKRDMRAATYPLALRREGELRAVWLSGGRVDDWDAIMADLADAGFNAVFPALCDAGGADYESDVIPRSRSYERDQLAACIEAAGKRNIEVHPWRINWRISRGTDERRAELRDADRLSVSKDGAPGEWLCPSDERNYQLEVAAMLEMAEKYPVAGIHFDYIRYHNANYCYCDKCRANFERDAEVTIDDWPADVLTAGAHYDAFQDWRREQITRVVREVHKRAHARQPDIVVSAAVFCNWPSSRVSIGQDAAAWAEEGIIDLLMPMTYTDSNKRLGTLTTQHVALTKGRTIIAEGIGAFSSHSQFTGPDQLIQQIETSRSLGSDGFCIFHYGDALKRGFLPALAEGCTGPRTFTPMLRPPAVFKLDGSTEGEWTFGPDGKPTVEATVEGRGPWTRAVASLDARLVLQGLDGRDIRVIGDAKTVAAGAAGAWTVELALAPGGYRLAIAGQATLEDGATQPFICRSRPLRVLTADEYALESGLLPAPEDAEGWPRVGVLVDGYGGKGILAALGNTYEVREVEVERITPEVARTCQVLIVTQGRDGPSVDEKRAQALRNWVESGGAILATHDAVGYRGHAPIAPDICKGGAGHEKETTVVVADSPQVPAEYRGVELEHAFFDHIVLAPGDRGHVIVTDSTGRPVVVIGELGKGRFVASGIAFGLNADTQEEEPDEAESEMLRALIRWLASGW